MGIVVLIGLAIFAYQTYFTIPEFENKTLTKGLQISLPIDSDFADVGNNTFHDDKTNLNIKILKSENDVVDANVNNPEKNISNGSNSINVFKNYIIVIDKEKNVGVKISNITYGNDIAMKIAENVVFSSSVKSKKIGEEKAKEIAQEYENNINGELWGDATSMFSDIILAKYKNKTVYKVSFTFQETISSLPEYVAGYPYRSMVLNQVDKSAIRGDLIIDTQYRYVDAYSGKILNPSK